MSILRTSLIAAVLTGAALVPSAVAQGASTTLSTEQAPTRVTAWQGTVLWSRLDPATGDYQLVKSVGGGAPIAVGVPERDDQPFDIDLGTSRSGALIAVYTRDGDIYRLDVATGVESKVVKLSSTRIERDPTIQRGLIAFVREAAPFQELRIANSTDTSKGSRRLVRTRARTHWIVNAELGARHIAWVESVLTDFSELRVHIRNIRTGADQRVYRAGSGGANAAGVTRPSYVTGPDGFVWARTNTGSGSGNRLVRYTLAGSKLTYAPGSPRYISTGWAGDALGAVTASSLYGFEGTDACVYEQTNYCPVKLTGPLSFTSNP